MEYDRYFKYENHVFFRISWQVTKDITILDTTKIKIVNVFDKPTACSSEELVLFNTLTSIHYPADYCECSV
jgi:hypothetical protein